MDGSGCRNAKLVAGSSGRVDLTQRQAAERSVSVSVNRSPARSDHTRQGSVNGGTHASGAKRIEGTYGKALLCKAHDRQRVKDAVKPLRGCGVRVVHAALLRVQVAQTDAPVLRCLGLEIRVCGLSITLDFWLHAGSAVVEILNDIGGQYLFKERFFSPQSHTGSFN